MSSGIDKQAEEARRNRHWDPVQRWKAILQTIAFAEAQQRVTRNSRQACLEQQARLNRTPARRRGG